jgi:hypothetical protein
VVAHRLGQDEAYFTVREILAEASTAADGVLWREPRDFGRCGLATLGLTLTTTYQSLEDPAIGTILAGHPHPLALI